MKLRHSCAILLTGAVFFAPGAAAASSGGSITGTVTCGADEATPAGHALVNIQGTALTTHTDGGGRFTLLSAPASQLLTVNAQLDANGSVLSSRYNVQVEQGQTLDIGNIDIGACPQAPVDVAPEVTPLWDGGAE